MAENTTQRKKASSVTFPLLAGLLRHLQTPLYANAYYLMANTAVNALSGLVFWTISARFYAADQVGIASAIISATTFLSSLSSLGLGTGLIRFLPDAGNTQHKILDSSMTLTALTSILVVAVSLAGLPIWSPALTPMYDQLPLLLSFGTLIFLASLGGLVSQVFVACRIAKFSFFSSLITSTIRICLLFPLAAIGKASGILVSVTIAVAVSLGIALTWLLPIVQNGYHPHIGLDVKILRSIVPYSVGNYLATLLAQTPQVILPVIVLNKLGPEESAYSYVAWMLASMMFMISGAISTSAFAETSNRQEMLSENSCKALGLTVMLTLPAVLILLLAGDRLLLLFGTKYAEKGTRLLVILALSAFPTGINNIYFAIKRVTKEISIILILSIFIAVGTMGLGYCLLPYYGIAGTGISWLVSQGLVTGFVVCSTLLKRLGQAQQQPNHQRSSQ